MKKTFTILASLLVLVGMSSCGDYCAECTELGTGYEAEAFCGTNSEVKTYIEELEDTGQVVGQNWDCSKVKD